MNSALVILVVILLVIIGANRIGNAMRDTSMRVREDTINGIKRGYGEVVNPKTSSASDVVKKNTTGVDELTTALFDYFDMEGWNEPNEEGAIKVINNPIISDMLDDLNKEVRLELHLPRLGVGVYTVEAPKEEWEGKSNQIRTWGYRRLINYNGYLVGYDKSQRN